MQYIVCGAFGQEVEDQGFKLLLTSLRLRQRIVQLRRISVLQVKDIFLRRSPTSFPLKEGVKNLQGQKR